LTLFQVFRSSSKPATLAPSLRRVPPPAPAAPPPVKELQLEARTLANAWLPDEGRLVVTTLSPVGRGQRVLVNVSGLGGVTLGVTGLVTTVCANGGACLAEIEVDQERRPLVGRILEFLKGNAPKLMARAPRYGLSLPTVVYSESGNTYMNTFSVSTGGCGLTWSGPPPRLGGGVHVRLGSGAGAASFRAVVRWTRPEPKSLRVGLRFLDGEEAKLAALLGEANRGAVVT